MRSTLAGGIATYRRARAAGASDAAGLVAGLDARRK
jgi:hypothetical protein